MRQAIRLTKEVTPGTFHTGADPADVLHLRIIGDNGFPDRSTPNLYYVRDAAGSNRNVQVGYGSRTATGRFETLLYASQAELLLSGWCNLVSNGLDFKLPYTFTMDHLVQLEDTGATVVYGRYLGVTGQDLMLRAGNQGDAQKFAVSATFWYLNYADSSIAGYATPTLASYPADLPMNFQQLGGGILINSSAFVSFKSFELSVKNISKGIYDESVYPQKIGWYGRDVTWRLQPRWKSQAQRTAFNAVTARTAVVTLTDGTNVNTFDFKGNNIVTDLKDSTPLNDAFYQDMTTTALVDATAGTDFVYSFSDGS